MARLVNVRTCELPPGTRIIIDVADPELSTQEIDKIRQAVEKWAGSGIPVLVKPFGTEIVIEYRNNLVK
tara:strand:+ start:4795 stop:5001 length:207 start_codon:yes stop_codon:yes gene_type:complete